MPPKQPQRILPDNFNTSGTDTGRQLRDTQFPGPYRVQDPESLGHAHPLKNPESDFPNTYRALEELGEKLGLFDQALQGLRDRLGPVINHDCAVSEAPENLRGFCLRTPLDHRVSEIHDKVDYLTRCLRNIHEVLAL